MKLKDLFEYELNSRQKDWYLNEKATIIVTMPPELFLKLTVTSDNLDMIKSRAQSKEFYQDLMNKEQIGIPPFLSINDNGQVVGHEGRARAYAAIVEGDKEFQVGIKLYPGTRNASIKDIPTTWTGQFNKGVKFDFASRNSPYGAVKVINDNVQRQYQTADYKHNENVVNEYGVGRIVPGVNTTIDVKPDHIKTQAAKWRFTVDKDGRAPLLTNQKTLLQKLFDINSKKS